MVKNCVTLQTLYKAGLYSVVREDSRTDNGIPWYSFRIEGPDADKLMDSLMPNGENLELIVKRANIGYQAGYNAALEHLARDRKE